MSNAIPNRMHKEFFFLIMNLSLPKILKPVSTEITVNIR